MLATPTLAGMGPLGIPAGPDLDAAVASLDGIREGHGDAVLQVVFAPWCVDSPILFRDTRSILDRLSLRWIPFSGGQPEGREPTEILLRNRDPDLLPAAFVAIGQLPPPTIATPLCDRQDVLVRDTVASLVVRDTGRAFGTPTLVYRVGQGRIRVVPGLVTPEQLRGIAAVAT